MASSAGPTYVSGYHLVQASVTALTATMGIAKTYLNGSIDQTASDPIPAGAYAAGHGYYLTNGPTTASANSEVSVGVQLPGFSALSATYINKNLPTNSTYQPLPTPAVLYGGSVRFTSDELLLNAANSNPIAGTTYTWYASGASAPSSPSGGSTWNVIIPAAPCIMIFECVVQPPGGVLPTTKILTVEVGIRTDDVILVGWINQAAVPLSPTGVDPAVLSDLPFNGGTQSNVAGTARLAALADNDDYLDYVTCTTVNTPADKNYILNYILDWMFHFANTPDPTLVLTSLQTPDSTDPMGHNTTTDLTTTAGYISYPKLVDYMSDAHRFKLLNHFQVKYRVNLTAPTFFNGSPVILQSGAAIGATVNPTGVPPNLGPAISELSSLPYPFNIPGLAAAYVNQSLLSPQSGPANGLIGPVPAVDHTSQCNDGSPEVPGIRAFNTLTGADVATPLFWQNIGSKITFQCGNTAPNPPTHKNYPTYNWYENGLFIVSFAQAKTPLGHFYMNPYPFGTDPSYGLLPEGSGNVPLIPGSPSFPTLPGGRNGLASAPGDASSSTPAYTVP